MNLAFFLTPVGEVVWLSVDASVDEALVSMRRHRYTAVPLLDRRGGYVGTLTEGDVLYHLVDRGPSGGSSRLSQVPRRVENRAVGIDTDVRELLHVAVDQNFVPVVDSRGVLMGIVRRKAILAQLERLLRVNGLLPARPEA
jgi:CBS domain-containing protein